MRRIKRIRNLPQAPVRFSKRVSNPPLRYPAREYIAKSRRVVLKPFPGQPRRYRERIRLPMLVIKQSCIHNAGFGLFLGERVRARQTLTMYSTVQISEAYANFLKMKVNFFSWSLCHDSVGSFLTPFCTGKSPHSSQPSCLHLS